MLYVMNVTLQQKRVANVQGSNASLITVITHNDHSNVSRLNNHQLLMKIDLM